MKRAALLTLSALLCIISCKESTPTFTFGGRYGNGNDTLYLFGLDSRHARIDTLLTDKKGKFTYSLATDTIIPMTLVLPDGTTMPVYAEPEVNATLITDSTSNQHWHIAGGAAQTLCDSITKKLDSIQGKTQRYAVIDAFIEQHPLSEVNIHLLQKYLIETPDAKNSLIRQRINNIGGTLHDNSYIAEIKKIVTDKNRNIQHISFPHFSYTLPDSTIITRNSYDNKYLLVNIWASWDSASIRYLRNIRHLTEELDTAYFAMLNISLDHDTAAWHKAIAADSITGIHVCDKKMWESYLVNEFTIEKLPFTVLVSPYQRAELYNPRSEEITEHLDSVIDKFRKNDVKRKKKAEKDTKAKREKELKQKEQLERETKEQEEKDKRLKQRIIGKEFLQAN